MSYEIQPFGGTVSDESDLPDRQSLTHALNRHINQTARERLNHPIVGLSISSCVLDIAIGMVNIKNVVRIVAGTKAKNQKDWDVVIRHYRQNHWYQFPDEAEQVIRQLLADGKIVQPRVSENRFPVFVEGRHWVKLGQEIQYQRTA